MIRRLNAPVAAQVSRLVDWWRCPTIAVAEPLLSRSGDEHRLLAVTGRRWRWGVELVLTTEAAEVLAGMLARDVVDARAWRARSGPPPVHVGGNAEDCPACALLPSEEIPYPWHCPGPKQSPPQDPDTPQGAQK